MEEQEKIKEWTCNKRKPMIGSSIEYPTMSWKKMTVNGTKEKDRNKKKYNDLKEQKKKVPYHQRKKTI